MTKEKIERINALAHKSKTPEGLTPAERAEQLALREEYLAQFRASFAAQLEHTVIEYPDGTREHLKRKDADSPHEPHDVNNTPDANASRDASDASNAKID